VDHDPYPDDVHHMMPTSTTQAPPGAGQPTSLAGTLLRGRDNDKFARCTTSTAMPGRPRISDTSRRGGCLRQACRDVTPAARPCVGQRDPRSELLHDPSNGGFALQKVAIMDPPDAHRGEKSYLKDASASTASPGDQVDFALRRHGLRQTCDKHFEKGRQDARPACRSASRIPGNIGQGLRPSTKKVIGVRRMGRQIISARDPRSRCSSLGLAMRKGAPSPGMRTSRMRTPETRNKRDNSACCGEIKPPHRGQDGRLRGRAHVPRTRSTTPSPKRPSARSGVPTSCVTSRRTPTGSPCAIRSGTTPPRAFMVSHPGVEGEESRSRLDPPKIRDYYEPQLRR